MVGRCKVIIKLNPTCFKTVLKSNLFNITADMKEHVVLSEKGGKTVLSCGWSNNASMMCSPFVPQSVSVPFFQKLPNCKCQPSFLLPFSVLSINCETDNSLICQKIPMPTTERMMYLTIPASL